MQKEQVMDALNRIEQQNDRILAIIEQIAQQSFKYRGKNLPSEKPDFGHIEQILRKIIGEAEFSEAVIIEEFVAKEWLAQVRVLHPANALDPPTSLNAPGYWDTLRNFVRAVQSKAGIPGRIAGSYSDIEDFQRVVGSILEFGYSREVGYDYENEFRVDRHLGNEGNE